MPIYENVTVHQFCKKKDFCPPYTEDMLRPTRENLQKCSVLFFGQNSEMIIALEALFKKKSAGERKHLLATHIGEFKA